MADRYVHVESKGFFGKLSESFTSVLIGLLLLVVAPILLFWNEGRAVHTAQGLDEAAGAVIEIKPEPVDPANEGKLVHVIGKATTSEMLADPQFGVSAVALRLRRKVEMYQWKESEESTTRKKLGGGEETVKEYTYEKDWDEDAEPSKKFKHPEGHENPTSWPVKASVVAAQRATLGAFVLTNAQLAQLGDFQGLQVTDAMLDKVAPDLKGRTRVSNGMFYIGNNPATPQVGDLRVSFATVAPQTVSVISRQQGQSFQAYQTKAGTSIDLMYPGEVTANDMIQSEKQTNTILTWVFRALGFVFMWIGIACLFSPVQAFANIIPFFGDILGAGIGFFSFIVAAAGSLLVISIAWIAYRPLLGVALLGAVVLILFFGKSRGKSSAPPAAAP